MANGYSRPTGGNAFKDPALQSSSFAPSPFILEYKKLNVGDFVDLRIISLSRDDIEVIEARKATIKNPKKNNQPMTVIVHDPGKEIAETISDQFGNRLDQCDPTKLFRVPVAVKSITRMNGKNREVEELDGKLMFIEFGTGLKISLDKMEGAQEGAGGFNEETGRPDYDVRLRVVNGNKGIPRNYEFEPILLEGTKPSKTFGVELEEAYPDWMDGIMDGWEELREAMAERQDEAEIRRQLKERDGSGGGAGRQRVSNRPELGEDEPESEVEETSETETEQEETKASGRREYKFGGRRTS